MMQDFNEKMLRLEFYVEKVVDFTSRYNYSNSCYYAPTNLIGEYEKYPAYGDFAEAYCVRSYGNWAKKSESYQTNYRPQDYDNLHAEDYVTVEFEGAVIPKDICVYETYNPGAVVRIWGKQLFETPRPWVLLWEGKPEILPKKSRKFHPQIKKINYLINTVRLEFSQTHLEYHYAVEAILLGGYQPTSILETNILSKGLLNNMKVEESKNDVEQIEQNGSDHFLHLPNEIILHIFQYLDLKSLSRCATVNKRFNEVSADAILYQNINLKPYWYLVNCDTLEYFLDKCKNLKKMDLSWCGNDAVEFGQQVVRLLRMNSHTITHLSLCNCKFLDCPIMTEIAVCNELVDLRLKNTNWHFDLSYPLEELNKLVSLDLTSSDIEDGELMGILKANPNLKILILDLCENLQRLDQVVESVATHNKNISTWSSWKTLSLTAEGVKHFRSCPNVQELDLGWCLINKDPGNCLNYVAEGCPQLRRLILSEWRGLNDNLVAPILESCNELAQLDLLGIKNITGETCERALSLPKLRLLDVSYCDSISQDEVNLWKHQYPHITIQKNY